MIDKAARKNLFKIVDAYARATGLSISTISGRIYGNQAFLSDFREGRIKSMTLRKIDEMLGKLDAVWPEKVKWPKTTSLLMDRPVGKKSVKPRTVPSAPGIRIA